MKELTVICLSARMIETVQDYPTTHEALLEFAYNEKADDARPELMALHLGLHWNMVLSKVCKAGKPSVSTQTRFMSVGAALVAGYGLYAFLKNQFLSYLFLRTHFVFFDFERPVLLFFAEYIATMGFVCFPGALQC